jgi:prepilin-type N-terminal cleavage/methylation domain-containing protein
MIGDKRAVKRRGFTLVEVLVVMASFTILVTLISDIYVQTARFGRSVVLHAKLQADARNAMEAVSRAVRVSNIDYAIWGGTLPAQPMTELRLINPTTGNASRIKFESTDSGCFSDAKSYPCVTVSTDGGTTWTPLSPRGARIDSLLFYVAPSQDPFLFNQETGTYAGGDQPFVIMSMKIHGLGTRPSDDWVYTLQTTTTPRLYLR